MEVRNHWIEEIKHTQTSNLSPGTITPRFIVMHYTAGWSGAASRDWLMGEAGGHPTSRVSAHVVVDQNGTAWQIAPFNRRTWHAGPSRYGSTTDLNNHSIGIEFANVGWLRRVSATELEDHTGRRITEERAASRGYIEAAHSRVGSGSFCWPTYPARQIEVGLAITAALIAKYQIEAILTHEEIDTRGWKTDPGPAFPMRNFIDLLGHGGPVPVPTRFVVAATRLNLRAGPSSEAERMDPPGSLPRHTIVDVLREQGAWRFIEVVEAPGDAPGISPGLRGWVHREYLDPA